MKLFKIFLISLLLCVLMIKCTIFNHHEYFESSKVKEKIKDKELFYLIDSLIINYSNFSKIIKQSKFYNSDFSDIQIEDQYTEDFLKECFTKGYEFEDNYVFNITDQSLIKENAKGMQRYPDIKSNEGVKVDKIANILLKFKTQIQDSMFKDGCLVFTFCHTKDGTWYLRLIFPEYYDPIPDLPHD